MKLSELKEKLNLNLLTEQFSERDVTGCYIGDLLSWVMGKAQSGDAWITIMNNINIVAVAALTDCACIILCEGVTVGDEILAKANDEGIVIFTSDKTAYQLAKELCGEI